MPHHMELRNGYYLLVGLLILLERVRPGAATNDEEILVAYDQYNTTTLNRSSFPADFIFGASSSSYQVQSVKMVEGQVSGTLTLTNIQRITDGSNGDVADDSYNRYKEDVGIMKKMGLDAYRLSISWSRILPKGKLDGGINKLGVKYYSDLINELLLHGIQPYVTLFHWDLPQSLENEYGGFLNSRIVKDFVDYAEVCFKEFGDRVKHWFTINEPYQYSSGGYATGQLAPGRCSAWQQLNCTGGDSATEPYIISHHLLLAHASTVKLYREKYQANQKGKIGITHAASWAISISNAKRDVDATQRYVDFILGWFLNPMTYGDYPKSMRTLVGSRLPKFTKEESEMLKGSFDFIGLNYYTTIYAKDAPSSNGLKSFLTDSGVNTTGERDGVLIGPKGASSWLYIYPPGIREMLIYVKQKYKGPLTYITENGVDELNNSTLPLEQQLADPMRIAYYHDHLLYLQKAIEDGVNVKGYFAWSLLDNFEWSSGFTIRFGINYVDYKNGLKRYPKHSSIWFQSFLKKSN